MNNDLNINVNVNLTISDEMAERCISILNMYLRDTGRTPILTEMNDGKRTFNFWRLTL